MSKKFLFPFIIGLAVVAAAVLWLLSAIPVNGFENFNASWAIAILSGVCALAFIFRALFEKSALVPMKKLYVFIGAGFAIVCIFMIISATSWEAGKRLIAPIIGVVLAVALLLSILFTGGKKWDQADNKNVGYKNYNQRKAEEEAARKKEESGK